MKILIQFPTRERRGKFLEVLKVYFRMLSGKHDVRVQIVCDRDDSCMQDENLEADVSRITKGGKFWVRKGDHRNKVEAVNAFLGTHIGGWEWDVCILASDDMIPQVQGYDDVIAKEMKKHFPDTDGVLWFNDGYLGTTLNTLSILGREFYRRFDYLYYPGCKSFFVDNDFQERAALLGRQVYFEQCIIRHEHPANNANVPTDELYRRNDAPWHEDRLAYEAHAARKFDIPLLDILVCCVPERAKLWDQLKRKLAQQIESCKASTNVQIIELPDDKKMSIGEKRNRLLDRSTAEYLCFVDDDDNVSPTYVRDILDAIGDCEPDVVGLKGQVLLSDTEWCPFVHSVEYHDHSDVKQGNGIIKVRPPNHLNAMRASIAKKYRFPSVNHGEDTEWSMKICHNGVLKSQVMVERPLYYYAPSFVYNRYGITGWSEVVKRKIVSDHSEPLRRSGEQVVPRVVDHVGPPGDEPTPGMTNGPVVQPGQAAPQNIGYDPDPAKRDKHRVGIKGWRWEGTEAKRIAMLRAVYKKT